ncbi:MAG: hypothetical protein OXD49_16295 [Candidatus Poribacteria bacterium]|nr:hypothetical protein [Candidatus Poribacteria bacterium]
MQQQHLAPPHLPIENVISFSNWHLDLSPLATSPTLLTHSIEHARL